MELVMLLAMAIGAALAFYLLIVGLLQAPWPILLGGLVLTLYAFRGLSAPSQAVASASGPKATQQQSTQNSSQASANQTSTKEPSSKSQESSTESLTYRGVHYSKKPPSSQDGNDKSAAVGGTYQEQHSQNLSSAEPTPSSSIELTYRGCKIKQPKPIDPST